MENQIRKTPMQELVEIIYKTREILSKDEKFKDYDYTLNVETMVNLLKNSYEIESAVLSHAFDFGFLQSGTNKHYFESIRNGKFMLESIFTF